MKISQKCVSNRLGRVFVRLEMRKCDLPNLPTAETHWMLLRKNPRWCSYVDAYRTSQKHDLRGKGYSIEVESTCKSLNTGDDIKCKCTTLDAVDQLQQRFLPSRTSSAYENHFLTEAGCKRNHCSEDVESLKELQLVLLLFAHFNFNWIQLSSWHYLPVLSSRDFCHMVQGRSIRQSAW